MVAKSEIGAWFFRIFWTFWHPYRPWICLCIEMGNSEAKTPCVQLWQVITLQPFELQRPTVPFWKDLNHVFKILPALENDRTFKIFFAWSKYPYFTSYSEKCLYSFSITVHNLRVYGKPIFWFLGWRILLFNFELFFAE